MRAMKQEELNVTGRRHIQIIVGSVREGSVSLSVGRWANKIAARRTDITAELVDLREWNLPLLAFPKPPAMGDYEDELQKRWAAKIGAADGYVFVTAEYNHGYSAALKNALDYLFSEWHRKPAAFVAFGNTGGARSVEQLRLVLVELQMAPLSAALHIHGVGEKLNDGVFIGNPSDERRFDAVVDDLAWWASALSRARKSLVKRKENDPS